jgi:uncharacterized protein (DUF433 family)
MNYQHIISIEPGKRGGRPFIRHMRIAVGTCSVGSRPVRPINK